jgi:hypothetical protein
LLVNDNPNHQLIQKIQDTPQANNLLNSLLNMFYFRGYQRSGTFDPQLIKTQTEKICQLAKIKNVGQTLPQVRTLCLEQYNLGYHKNTIENN